MSRRWRRLSRSTNLAVCAPACGTSGGSGNSGTSLAWNWTSSLIAHTRCIVRTIEPTQRALDADREVDARRPLPWRVDVVDDVDAADEGDPAVDVDELAVQPPQPVRPELPRRDFGPILEQRHAARDQRRLERARQVVPRAPAVDHHAHRDTARGRPRERRRDDPPRVVIGKDVCLEPDLVLGAVDRADEHREVLAAAAQERDAVARNEPGHRGRRVVSNVAASAAWSDIRRPERYV